MSVCTFVYLSDKLIIPVQCPSIHTSTYNYIHLTILTCTVFELEELITDSFLTLIVDSFLKITNKFKSINSSDNIPKPIPSEVSICALLPGIAIREKKISGFVFRTLLRIRIPDNLFQKTGKFWNPNCGFGLPSLIITFGQGK